MTSLGSTGPFNLPPRQTRRARDGVIIESRVKVRNDELAAYIASLGNLEYDVDPLDDTPFSIVTVANPDSEDASAILSDVWGVSYNEEQISIWNLPKVRAELAKAAPDLAALFRADVESLMAGNRTVTDADGNDIELTFDGLVEVARGLGMDTAVIRALITSMGEGSDHKVVSLPVLSRSTTLPVNTTLSPAFDNIGAIYSTTALVSAESTIPANITAELPTGHWVKKSPTANQQEDGRWQYQIEYWYVEPYDSFLYDTVYS